MNECASDHGDSSIHCSQHETLDEIKLSLAQFRTGWNWFEQFFSKTKSNLIFVKVWTWNYIKQKNALLWFGDFVQYIINRFSWRINTVPALKELKYLYWSKTNNIVIQMNRKQLTKTFMMIFKLKNVFSLHGLDWNFSVE